MLVTHFLAKQYIRSFGI